MLLQLQPISAVVPPNLTEDVGILGQQFVAHIFWQAEQPVQHELDGPAHYFAAILVQPETFLPSTENAFCHGQVLAAFCFQVIVGLRDKRPLTFDAVLIQLVADQRRFL